MKTVLICGGRDYADTKRVRETVISLAEEGFDQIIEGGATGADTLAREAGWYFELDVVTYWANWGKYGKSGGGIRNHKMLTDGMPQLVVAFPGGRGTADMVGQALAYGVEVRKIDAHTKDGVRSGA